MLWLRFAIAAWPRARSNFPATLEAAFGLGLALLICFPLRPTLARQARQATHGNMSSNRGETKSMLPLSPITPSKPRLHDSSAAGHMEFPCAEGFDVALLSKDGRQGGALHMLGNGSGGAAVSGQHFSVPHVLLKQK